MSVATEIQRLQLAKSAIRQAILDKGVEVAENATLDTYPQYIEEISGGGGDEEYINFLTGTGDTITLPNGLLELGVGKMYRSGYTTVNLPNSLTKIGDYCFNQANLTGITIPDNVREIGNYAFISCSGLTSVNLNEGLLKIGNYAFSGCTNLTEITFPSTLLTIGNYAFERGKLTGVTIPSSVTSIGIGAFSGCTGITTINYEGTADIMTGAFANCSGMTGTIKINGGTIGDTAFVNCRKIDVELGGSAFINIGNNTFDGCSGLTLSYIPSNVKIGDYTFRNCSGITELVCDNALAIGKYAFANCSGMTTLNCNATKIDVQAFMNCKNLTTATFGNKVTSFSSDLFYGCTNLNKVICNGSKLISIKNTPIKELIVESGSTVGTSGFTNNTELKTVYIDSNTISDACFSGCTSLEEVIIGDHCTSIGNRAFYNCSKLKRIVVGKNVSTLVKEAFDGCINLERIEFKRTDCISYMNSLRTFPFGAYSGTTYAGYNVENPVIIYPQGGTNYNNNTSGYSWMYVATTPRNTDVKWYYYNTSSQTVKGYGWTLQEEGSDNTTLVINYGEDIEQKISQVDMSKIKKVIVDTEEISPSAFYPSGYITAIEEVVIGDHCTSIGANAFYDCTKLKKVTIGSNVTTMDLWSFYGCVNLEKITFKSQNCPHYNYNEHPFGFSRNTSHESYIDYAGANITNPVIEYPSGGTNYANNTSGYSWMYVATTPRSTSTTYYNMDGQETVKGYGFTLRAV